MNLFPPDICRLPAIPHYGLSSREADRLRDRLCQREGLVCWTTAFSGCLWLRISANIYSSRQDYLTLRNVFLGYINTK